MGTISVLVPLLSSHTATRKSNPSQFHLQDERYSQLTCSMRESLRKTNTTRSSTCATYPYDVSAATVPLRHSMAAGSRLMTLLPVISQNRLSISHVQQSHCSTCMRSNGNNRVRLPLQSESKLHSSYSVGEYCRRDILINHPEYRIARRLTRPEVEVPHDGFKEQCHRAFTIIE